MFSASNAITDSRSGSFELEMSPEEALPLFTALGEKFWIPTWDPVVLNGDGVETGTVFVTSNQGHKTHWIVMDYDSQAYHALYVRVTPEVDAGTVDVSLVSNGKGGSVVTVSYELTAGCVSKVVEIGFGASPSGLSFAAVRPRGQGFRRRLADRGFPIHRLCASGFGRKRGAPRGASALFRDTAARSVF